VVVSEAGVSSTGFTSTTGIISLIFSTGSGTTTGTITSFVKFV
jgi:hypothetical protein